MGAGRVEIAARAKVNLFLEVHGKRADGYHEIETVLQEIDLADDVAVESLSLSGGGPRVEVVSRGDASVPSGPANTAHAAATLFLERFAPRAAVRVEIEKRVPSGAGLGGGSADAAATLRGLARLLEVEAPEAALHEVAARVGSDVPFFLVGGLAVARGRGERVEPLPGSSGLSFVVVAPPFPCSTAAVYGAYSDSLTMSGRRPTIPPGSVRFEATTDFGKVVFNRLEEAAARVEPRLRELKERFAHAAAESAAPVFLTGSGSALVAAVASDGEARSLESRLPAEIRSSGCRVFVCRSVSRAVR